MLDIQKAGEVFKNYLKQYDINDERIALKTRHTYSVLGTSEYLAQKLNLSEENENLAKLIALLHDIGRFEQLKKFDTYDDTDDMDHAKYGIKILFQKNMIREFIKNDNYDNIIYKAIENHNKYKIDDGLNETELLHAKIIRDSDKLDNFKLKTDESFKALFGIEESQFVKQKITDKIYNNFMNCELISSKDTVTNMDDWVLYIAFIFDLNYEDSFRYVKENDYINKIIDRVQYENEDTKVKMQKIKEFVNEYIDKKISSTEKQFT